MLCIKYSIMLQITNQIKEPPSAVFTARYTTDALLLISRTKMTVVKVRDNRNQVAIKGKAVDSVFKYIVL